MALHSKLTRMKRLWLISALARQRWPPVAARDGRPNRRGRVTARLADLGGSYSGFAFQEFVPPAHERGKPQRHRDTEAARVARRFAASAAKAGAAGQAMRSGSAVH